MIKLKLIFPYPAWKKHSDKYFISIKRNKIHNYIGLNPIQENLIAKKQISEKFINSTFTLSKLDNLDRKEFDTKATHEIFSQELHNVVKGRKYCIKLNWYQEIYVNWYLKSTVFHKYKWNVILNVIFWIISVFFLFLNYNLKNRESYLITERDSLIKNNVVLKQNNDYLTRELLIHKDSFAEINKKLKQSLLKLTDSTSIQKPVSD